MTKELYEATWKITCQKLNPSSQDDIHPVRMAHHINGIAEILNCFQSRMNQYIIQKIDTELMNKDILPQLNVIKSMLQDLNIDRATHILNTADSKIHQLIDIIKADQTKISRLEVAVERLKKKQRQKSTKRKAGK